MSGTLRFSHEISGEDREEDHHSDEAKASHDSRDGDIAYLNSSSSPATCINGVIFRQPCGK